jgi:hypothetical protein
VGAIEPLDDEGIYARFLAEKGEGVHHLASCSELRGDGGRKGQRCAPQRGEFSGIRIGTRGADLKPDAT